MADDEQDILALIGLRLERAGYRVSTAVDGEQALRLAADRHPALAIIDVRMPGLDGYELTKRLRERGETATMPIVLLSANVQQSDVEKGRAAGADSYLRKPFNPPELLGEVERLLGQDRG